MGYVGVELTLMLRASDVDGDELSYRFEAQGPSELGARGQVRPYNDGSTALFRWTPLANDIGTWNVDFIVSDGSSETRETVTIDVVATPGTHAPTFVRPSGPGTALDLGEKSCLIQEIEIHDTDDTEVELTLAEPLVAGAKLEQTSPTTGTLEWCPTAEQIAADDSHTIVIRAKDASNPAVDKPYTVLLRQSEKPLGVCAACTNDAQCGEAGDNCVTVGAGDFCGEACSGDGDCPDTHQCSPSALTSKDGAVARQCVPKDGSCTTDPEVCVDDGREENDSLEAAAGKPPLELVATVPGLKTCPSDVDWYRLVVEADSEVTVAIAGTSASDLDLVLTDNRGRTVDRSLTNSSNETVTHCLPPGTYYAQVRTYGPQQPNTYSLTTSGANVVCPDQGEEDDTVAQSRAVTLFGLPWLEVARRITANDDDYHKVYLIAGDTLEVRLDFVHSAGDLDIHLLSASGIDLTPCTEEDPLIPGTCKTEWGQGTSSPEILTYPITTSGYYHVVVHGWDGDANRYAVCITADGGC